MADIRRFNSYNFVTGAVDGTLAYDFSNPEIYQPEEEVIQDEPKRRPRRKEKLQPREWVREDVRPDGKEEAAAKNRQGFSLVSLLGGAVVVVMLTMMLLAQIRLTDISDTAAKLERQIDQLETQRNKLTVEYESIFNLEDVEERAVNVLGMQEPDNEQIYYLTGVASADRAEVVTKQDADMFSLGLADILSSIKAYFS